jgi:hypothetical protein
MSPPVQRNDSLLQQVGATIILLSSPLGIFHYNKLVYLFEYHYIKNFGRRFTKEVFLKYPRGPVITGYKEHLVQLAEMGGAGIDLKKLSKQRSLDDVYNEKVPITVTDRTVEFIVQNPIIFSFIKSLCERFASKSVDELQKIVYETEPMKKYVKSPYKKSTGGYILCAECIRLSDHSNPISEGRRKAQEYLEQHPDIDYAQHRNLAGDFSDLAALRPA